MTHVPKSDSGTSISSLASLPDYNVLYGNLPAYVILIPILIINYKSLHYFLIR